MEQITIKKTLSKLVKKMYNRYILREYNESVFLTEKTFIDNIRFQEETNNWPIINIKQVDYNDMTDDEFIFQLEEEVQVVKTCLCTNIIGIKKVCTRNFCTFAHYEEEWQPQMCNFNTKCTKKQKCQRLHGNETKLDAINRLGIVFLSKKKYVNQRFHLIEYIMNKNKK